MQAHIGVTPSRDVLHSSSVESVVYDEQATAVRGSAFVQLSIIMKTAPRVKWIMCECRCSAGAVLWIRGWTGCLKSPTQSFMSAGIMVASPDRLDVQSATSSVCRSAWIGYYAVRPANMSCFLPQIGKNSMTCCVGCLGNEERRNNFQLLIRSSLYSMWALPGESLSCYSAPGQIAEFHFISFLSSQLPGCEGHEMLLNDQGRAKLNCEDHHFVFKGVEPKHPENKFNLYRRSSSVCLCKSAGVLGDRRIILPGGSSGTLHGMCISLYSYLLNESSASCNCNTLHNQ